MQRGRRHAADPKQPLFNPTGTKPWVRAEFARLEMSSFGCLTEPPNHAWVLIVGGALAGGGRAWEAGPLHASRVGVMKPRGSAHMNPHTVHKACTMTQNDGRAPKGTAATCCAQARSSLQHLEVSAGSTKSQAMAV